MKKMISIKELCEILSISINTLYYYTSKKMIPHLKIGRNLRFDIDEVNRWLELRKRGEWSKNQLSILS